MANVCVIVRSNLLKLIFDKSCMHHNRSPILCFSVPGHSPGVNILCTESTPTTMIT